MFSPYHKFHLGIPGIESRDGEKKTQISFGFESFRNFATWNMIYKERHINQTKENIRIIIKLKMILRTFFSTSILSYL